MKNFNTNKLTSYSNIFDSVPDNVVVCINENNNNKKMCKYRLFK